MVRVKIFCMQKNEDDILEQWILYHSYLFGIDNLYIVDNQSNPQSKSILERYQKKGLHVSEQPDYRHKGDYLLALMKETQDQTDIAIPLDIDEFIAIVQTENLSTEFTNDWVTKCLSFDPLYYLNRYPQLKDKLNSIQALNHFMTTGYRLGWSPCSSINLRVPTPQQKETFLCQNQMLLLKHYPDQTLSCDRKVIIQHLEQIPRYGRYAFMYYLTSRNEAIDYDHPIEDLVHFDLCDYEKNDGKSNPNKKFFDPHLVTYLDHGNHHGKVKGLEMHQYRQSQLVLFHFHHRGVRKLIEKCENDIRGLGYVSDLNDPQELKRRIDQRVNGSHNIETYLIFLTAGPGALLVLDRNGMYLPQLSQRIREIDTNTR